jgi:hypothetical protein
LIEDFAMAAKLHATKTQVTLRLSERARAKLTEQAANSGQDISAVASEVIEHAVTRPSIAEIMAPVRKQAAESGMRDEALKEFLRGELQAHRREKKAKSA